MGEQSVIFAGESWHLNSILKHSKATSSDISAALYILSEVLAVQCVVAVTHTHTLPLTASSDTAQRDRQGYCVRQEINMCRLLFQAPAHTCTRVDECLCSEVQM